MARGWDSKEVESQIQDAHRRTAPLSRELQLSPEQRARLARRQRLLLDRTRILTELQACLNPRFRSLLETELAWLDSQLELLQ
jgi:hypothetical protein